MLNAADSFINNTNTSTCIVNSNFEGQNLLLEALHLLAPLREPTYVFGMRIMWCVVLMNADVN